MPDYYKLGLSCQNCGKELEACAAPNNKGYSIKGLRELKYRHVDGTTVCVIIKPPRAYDGWLATREFEKAQRAAWDAEDAARTDRGHNA